MTAECTPKSAACVLLHSCTLLQLHVPVQTLNSCGEIVEDTVEICLMACLSIRQSSALCGLKSMPPTAVALVCIQCCLHPTADTYQFSISIMEHNMVCEDTIES